MALPSKYIYRADPTEMMLVAAQYGDIAAMDHMREHNAQVEIHTAWMAARHSAAALRYLAELNCPMDYTTYIAAATTDNVDAVKCLHDRGIPYECATSALFNASKSPLCTEYAVKYLEYPIAAEKRREREKSNVWIAILGATFIYMTYLIR